MTRCSMQTPTRARAHTRSLTNSADAVISFGSSSPASYKEGLRWSRTIHSFSILYIICATHSRAVLSATYGTQPLGGGWKRTIGKRATLKQALCALTSCALRCAALDRK